LSHLSQLEVTKTLDAYQATSRTENSVGKAYPHESEDKEVEAVATKRDLNLIRPGKLDDSVRKLRY